MNTDHQSNNKRIAKNTIYLYTRMLVTMCVSLYTTRVVINALGVADYGIYNVLGGIIGMLAYINTLLSGGTSRFLTMELAKGDLDRMRLTFSTSNLLTLIAALLILLFGETIGLWFVNTQLNIDQCRMDAANWVYQCALISCCLTVIQTPYTASIIAHEKMSIYAYMSIFDVCMKLMIAFSLLYVDIDKLKLYAALLLFVNALNVLVYRIICFRRFAECTFKITYEKQLFKRMLNYSGWNMIGAFSVLLNNYGINILLNIFFGTIVNAARGIALQVSNIIQQVYSNFQVASRPQIMKYYAQGDVDGMSKLISDTSRYSAMLLLCIAIPVCFHIDELLMLWLGHNPEYTSWFVRLIMIQSLFSAIDAPVGMGIHAVGKMKLPNLTSSFLYLSVFPLAYIAMKCGTGPIVSYIIYISITPIILTIDLWILHKYANFNRTIFIKHTLYPLTRVIAIGVIIPFVQLLYFRNHGMYVVFDILISVIYVSAIIFFFGLTASVRKKLFVAVIQKIKHN